MRRLSHVLGYGSRQAILMLGNATVALIVIQSHGEELWGGFIKVFVVVSLSSNIINWGNRDFLLRQFAAEPGNTSASFWESLISRSSLLVVGGVFLFFLFDPEIRYWCVTWLMAHFLYQSLDVFIVYHRRFLTSAFVELAGLAAILLSCFFWPLSVTFLIMIFALSFVLRTGLLLLSLPRTIWSSVGSPLENYLFFYKKAKWFFLIGFSGLLQSRIDLYTISVLLTDEEVGKYQIMISLLILVQTTAGFIMTPFSINLMRQPYSKMKLICQKMMGIGIVICTVGVLTCFMALRWLYGIQLPSSYLVWSFLLVFPIFSYLTWIYYLYGLNLEKLVMRWNFIGAVVNLIITIILISPFGILGALISSALVQCGLSIVFPLIVRSLNKNPSSALTTKTDHRD